jgi:hypothetical protein
LETYEGKRYHASGLRGCSVHASHPCAKRNPLRVPSAQATVKQPYAPSLGRSAIFLEVPGDRRP